MLRLPTLILTACAAAVLAQQPRPAADTCVPPPGGVPPSLPAKLLEGQGRISFPITTSSLEAQAFFNQGVAQMHSFWSREAERSFLQAAALDPSAPMPHWGIAMVAAGDYRPGFQLDLVDGRSERPQRGGGREARGPQLRAVEAARKARELAAVDGKATPLEKLYIEAVAARRDRASKDPNAGYVEGLRRLLASYPAEVEARSYLALQIMSGFVLPEKRPRAGSMEAVAILRSLLADAPDHPGVHHYVIHGFEGSAFASDAWPSCKRYAEIAPNIPHALHMPGHIYAQTGRWDDAASAFATAAANEIYWLDQDSLAGTAHHGHNVHFLAASHSFAGRLDEALKAARSLLEYKENPRESAAADNPRTAFGQGWFALMRTLVQHERWDDILGGAIPNMDRPRQRAWLAWARGLAHAAKADPVAASREAGLMEKALEELRKVAGGDAANVAPVDVGIQDLKAHILLAEGQADEAFKAFRAAADRERSLRYNEPPAYPRPVLEAMGWAAARSGRHDLAEQAFREALSQYPGSNGALVGLNSLGRAIRSGF
jgi:tetratricopeptide (TPR) repeat protein